MKASIIRSISIARTHADARKDKPLYNPDPMRQGLYREFRREEIRAKILPNGYAIHPCVDDESLFSITHIESGYLAVSERFKSAWIADEIASQLPELYLSKLNNIEYRADFVRRYKAVRNEVFSLC